MYNCIMSTKLLIVVIAIIVVVGGGYLFFNKGNSLYPTNNTPSDVSNQTNETSQISPAGVSIVVNEQNASGESGIATISESDGKVVVNLKLTGASTQAPQPAHFHKGTCEVPGDVIYPLTNVVNGESQTTLEVDMATLNSELPLILNVHKSKDEISVYTSCGEVSP